MIRKNTQLHKLYDYIITNYGSRKFTTEEIYKKARLIGLNPKSVGACLNQLKNKGILSNSGGITTSRGRIQKLWELKHRAVITK